MNGSTSTEMAKKPTLFGAFDGGITSWLSLLFFPPRARGAPFLRAFGPSLSLCHRAGMIQLPFSSAQGKLVDSTLFYGRQETERKNYTIFFVGRRACHLHFA